MSKRGDSHQTATRHHRENTAGEESQQNRVNEE